MAERQILITGGAGFIGWHLARRLSREPGNVVTICDNFRRGRKDDELDLLLRHANVKLVSLDITDRASLEQLTNGYDEVYHLAAVIGVKNVLSAPQDVLRVNGLGTLNLLGWLAELPKKPRLLFASTSEVYSWTMQFHTLPIPTPEGVPLALTDLRNPRSSYAGSKIFGELAVHHYGAAFGIPYMIVRYHNVYGPRMGWEHVIPELYQRARDGQNPLVVYSADHRRAFCHVDDAVEATIRALRTPGVEEQTINIGNDHERWRIGDLAQKILEIAGRNGVAIEPALAVNDPIPDRCPDLRRARELIGYEPRVSLDEGLTATLKWYSENSPGVA